MSDSTPTQRFDAPVPEDQGPPDPQKKSHGLMIALIAVGAAILIAIIVLLVVLLTGRSEPAAVTSSTPTPTASSASPTPSASSASATPRPTPTATATSGGESQPTGAAFTTFSPTTSVKCYKSDAPNFTPPPIPIEINWATVRADSAWMVQGTSDAAESKFMQIPLTGNQGDFPFEIDFPCYQLSANYTITLVGSDGVHVSKNWTVKNVGDHN